MIRVEGLKKAYKATTVLDIELLEIRQIRQEVPLLSPKGRSPPSPHGGVRHEPSHPD